MSNWIRNHLAVFFLALFSIVVLSLSLRGLPGNPNSKELNTKKWQDDGPFELSPDRGRFALLYSLIEDQSFIFSIDLARFTAPDVAVRPDGKFVSLFAPTVSYLIIPGYLIGRNFGNSQVGAFVVIAIFAFINAILVKQIAIRLGAGSVAAILSSMVFLFATPAYAYSIALYQHHISTFLILMSIYALLRWQSYLALSIIWFLCGLAVSIDNPNIFLLFPVGIIALGRLVRLKSVNKKYFLTIKPWGLLTFIVMLVPVGFFLWFNLLSNGNPLQLAGTLKSAEVVTISGQAEKSALANVHQGVAKDDDGKKKEALGFFKNRRLLNGFYIHFFSPDRGVIFFAPVILLGIFGFWVLRHKTTGYLRLLLAIIGVNILLYSMWGDPWGGWAFGSRYLIPSYALLAIGLALALTRWRRKWWFILLFILLFGYSVAVNTAGAITSNRNPPQVEVLQLEKISGVVQKYTVERNFDMLAAGTSKSFVFQTFLSRYMTAWQFYLLLTGSIIWVGLWYLWLLWRTPSEMKEKA